MTDAPQTIADKKNDVLPFISALSASSWDENGFPANINGSPGGTAHPSVAI